MGRTKDYITPDSKRVGTTLERNELKTIKKMSIDFELSEPDLVRAAVLHLIQLYESKPTAREITDLFDPEVISFYRLLEQERTKNRERNLEVQPGSDIPDS